jgi:hypothetical protein
MMKIPLKFKVLRSVLYQLSLYRFYHLNLYVSSVCHSRITMAIKQNASRQRGQLSVYQLNYKDLYVRQITTGFAEPA